jgi:curved DNA-binding protein CbpA
MTKQETYYDVLGIQQSATFEQIRAAYLEKVKAYHPDIMGSALYEAARKDEALRENLQARMKVINQAYTVLSDPEQRAKYDAELKGKTGGAIMKGADKFLTLWDKALQDPRVGRIMGNVAKNLAPSDSFGVPNTDFFLGKMGNSGQVGSGIKYAECGYCKSKMPADELEAHLKTCPEKNKR